MKPDVPDQQIPTLSEVVPLQGAKSISAQGLLRSDRIINADLLAKESPYSKEINEIGDEIADQVMHLVRARLSKILPQLLRDAVEEVLRHENQDSDQLP
jgi:hypothetical protein